MRHAIGVHVNIDIDIYIYVCMYQMMYYPPICPSIDAY